MNKREAAIIETFTGIVMLTGDDRGEVMRYMEELLERPIYTHELADVETQALLKQKSRADFIDICHNLTDVERVVGTDIKTIVCKECAGTGGLASYKKVGKGLDYSVCPYCLGRGLLHRRVVVSTFPMKTSPGHTWKVRQEKQEVPRD